MCGNIEIKAAFLCVVQISVATHFLIAREFRKELFNLSHKTILKERNFEK